MLYTTATNTSNTIRTQTGAAERILWYYWANKMIMMVARWREMQLGCFLPFPLPAISIDAIFLQRMMHGN